MIDMWNIPPEDTWKYSFHKTLKMILWKDVKQEPLYMVFIHKGLLKLKHYHMKQEIDKKTVFDFKRQKITSEENDWILK